MILRPTLLLSLIWLSASEAAAVSQAVRDACRDDYHAYCDKLEVGSEALRVCMREVATKLSKGCLKALVDNNEVTKADIERYILEMDKPLPDK